MTKSRRTCVLGGLLFCSLGLGLPRVSYGITGCTNAYLTGTYTAQVSSTNFMNVLNALNGAGTTGGATGATGATGSTGTTANPGGGFFGPGTPTTASGPSGPTGTTGAAGGTTGSVTNPGFASNPFSLNGALPGISRFFFDGNGNIIGKNPSITNANVNAGSYTINTDCTATIKLATGQNFNAVVVNGGAQVLFQQSDANSGGAVGSLNRSTDVCLDPTNFPASFGFSFFGAQQTNATTGGATGATGTTGSTGTTGPTPNFMPFSAVGQIQLNADGSFSLHEWISQNGKVQPVTTTGTYKIGSDCSLSLSFASSSGGTTGAVGGGSFTAPVMFRGALVNATSGLLVVQPDALTTVTGQFVAQ
jgi:hypothetical protein